MTKKQKLFCEEYLIDLNATQSAIRAGYSPKTAYSIGNELLNKPEIRACIDKALAERSARTGVNADRVIRELARVAFVNPTEVINTETAEVYANASDDDKSAIASVKVKRTNGESSDSIEREVRFADKLKALELLGRHLNMFTDRVELSGEVNTNADKLDKILEQLNE